MKARKPCREESVEKFIDTYIDKCFVVMGCGSYLSQSVFMEHVIGKATPHSLSTLGAPGASTKIRIPYRHGSLA